MKSSPKIIARELGKGQANWKNSTRRLKTKLGKHKGLIYISRIGIFFFISFSPLLRRWNGTEIKYHLTNEIWKCHPSLQLKVIYDLSRGLISYAKINSTYDTFWNFSKNRHQLKHELMKLSLVWADCSSCLSPSFRSDPCLIHKSPNHLL